MNLMTFIILANLAGFSMLFMFLLVRRREPRVTTITSTEVRKAPAISHTTESDQTER